MPIYAYKCSDCGQENDVLQKMSDPPLVECPNCHHQSLVKQVTAAGFQLKGSGWYATDFRDSGAKKKDAKAGASTESDGSSKGETDGGSKTETDGKTSTDTAAAPSKSTDSAPVKESGKNSEPSVAPKPPPAAAPPPSSGAS